MSSTATSLEHELRELIVKTLSLEGVRPEEIEPGAPLFGDGLGLDSIDALELGVAIQKKYGVTLDPNDESIRAHFESVTKLSNYIEAARPSA